MMQESTYYEILGVHKHSTQEEIRKAYKTLALKYHPDRLSGLSERMQSELVEKMKLVTNAYSTLKDETLRAEYDRQLFMKNSFVNSDSFKQHPFNNYSKTKYTYNYRSRHSLGGVLGTFIFLGSISLILLLVIALLTIFWPIIWIFIIIITMLSIVRSIFR